MGVSLSGAGDEHGGRLAWLDAVVRSLPDAVLSLDEEGVVRFAQVPGDSGLPAAEELLGRHPDQLFPVHVASRFVLAMAEARRTGVAQAIEFDLLLRPLATQLFEARISHLPASGFCALIRNITAWRRSEEELVQARDQALRASQLKSQFLSAVSHEIRTPLNGVLGITQLLRMASLPESVREYLDVLHASGETLLVLVNDLLDLSKIEAGRLELGAEAFDLSQLVSTTVRSFEPQALRKGLALSVTLPTGPPSAVRGDPTRVRQVLSNLVGNALKFTTRGQVKVTLTRAGADAVVDIEDTGPGVPADKREAIFEAFVQADASLTRRFGGTGLGLTISRLLARRMGGDVALIATSDQGSTFRATFALPACELPRPITAAAFPGTRPLKVLVAEDNALNARLTASLLEKLGHVATTVPDGREAVRASGEGGYDVLLMDVQMPELDGLEATRLIRARERGHPEHLPIVALTANAMKGDDLQCLSAGMDAHLPKPVSFEALRDMLSWFAAPR